MKPSATPTAYVENITYYEYEISMTITKINADAKGKIEDEIFNKLVTLISECSEGYTEKGTTYYRVFQAYLKKEICGIKAFETKECELTTTKLECGSLITESKLVLGVKGPDPDGISKGKAGNVIKGEIKNSKLGVFAVNKTSFNFTTKGEITKGTTATTPRTQGTTATTPRTQRTSATTPRTQGTSVTTPTTQGTSATTPTTQGTSATTPRTQGTSATTPTTQGTSVTTLTPPGTSATTPTTQRTSATTPRTQGTSATTPTTQGTSTTTPTTKGTSATTSRAQGTSATTATTQGTSATTPTTKGTSATTLTTQRTSATTPTTQGTTATTPTTQGTSATTPTTKETSATTPTTQGTSATTPTRKGTSATTPTTQGTSATTPTTQGITATTPTTQGTSATTQTTQGTSATTPTTQGTSVTTPTTQGTSATTQTTQGTSATTQTTQGTSATTPATQGTSATTPTTQATSATAPTTQGTSATTPTTQRTTATTPITQITTTTTPETQGTTATTPSSTKPKTQGTSATTPTAYVKNITYYEYQISMTLTEINADAQNKSEEQTFKILHTLISECSEEYTKERTIYYITFEAYLKKQICGIKAFENEECELTITKLECGSLITESKLVLGVKGPDPDGISKGEAGNVIKGEIENGKLGVFAVNKTSFNSTKKGETSKLEPTKKPPVAEPNVYVIVRMKYTWHEFCGVVEKRFRERIAERSHNVTGKKLKSTDIFIVNSKRNCANPDNTKEVIAVWFVALGSDANEVTIQIGNDLKNLLDSRQLRKLGNQFETRVCFVLSSLKIFMTITSAGV